MLNEVNVAKLLQSRTSVPVPRIVADSSDSGASGTLELGHHFILMENRGARLSQHLKDNASMPIEEQRSYIDHLVDMIAEMRDIKFTSSGCFTDAAGSLGSWVQVWLPLDTPRVRS